MVKTLCDICGEEIVLYSDMWLHVRMEGVIHLSAGEDNLPREMHIHKRCWPFKENKGNKEN